MLHLITGGSGSGKSRYAEDRILKLGPGRRVYVATMYPYDDESFQRIRRHRAMRAQKEFETIECYTALEKRISPGIQYFAGMYVQSGGQRDVPAGRGQAPHGGGGPPGRLETEGDLRQSGDRHQRDLPPTGRNTTAPPECIRNTWAPSTRKWPAGRTV